MNCPKCLSGKTYVVESFTDAEENHRLRRCRDCHHRFLTAESEVPMSELEGIREFKRRKLLARRTSPKPQPARRHDSA